MLGIDIDGVLADFVHAWRHLHNHLQPGSLIYSTGGQLEWDELTDAPLDEDTMWRTIDTFPFWLNMQPLVTPGEVEQLRQRAVQDGGVVYITSRKDLGGALTQTARWLEAGGFPYSENLVSARHKADPIREHGVTSFLDDNPRHLEELQGHTDIWVRDWKYNRSPEFDHLPRVSSLGEWLRSV